MNASQPKTQQFGGCATAIAIGVLTIVVGHGGFSFLSGAPLNLREEWASFLFQMLLVAVPFGLLSVARIRARFPWLVGIILTVAFWGFYYYVALRGRGDGTGANIGLGLLMLASPVIITAASLAASRERSRLP